MTVNRAAFIAERAVVGVEIELDVGPLTTSGEADVPFVIGPADGLLTTSEGIDGTPEIVDVAGPLGPLTAAWEDVQRTRLALDQRGIPAGEMKTLEGRLARQIRKALEDHPLWPWLSQYPGLGGVHTARLIALIGDPHRFPGRQCAEGHHHSAAVRSSEIGDPSGCGIERADGTHCDALIGPLRRGTGTRSLWHYLGLHVVNGRSPRKTKGQRADWNPKGRTTVLMPGGIAEQIVRHRVPHYRDMYDATKERLSRERAAVGDELGQGHGPLPIDTAAVGPFEIGAAHGSRAEAEDQLEIGRARGLRPIQIEGIARKVAAKAFVADLLAEWKAKNG